MTGTDPARRNSLSGGILTLATRSLLLWLVVPLAAIIWIFINDALRRRSITFGQYLGWVDVNLIAALQRTVYRPLIRWPLSYVPARDMHTVTHRIQASDPY